MPHGNWSAQAASGRGFIMSFWSNCLRKFRAIAAGAALVALWSAASPASAQDQQPSQTLSGQQLQQLVAPVALYPDPLLAQILTASTYPLELVMAARWSKDNPDLKGKDLEDAMQQQPWDPSVKGLTAVPQVLAMMSDKLDWTQQLGEAFLAQPDDITQAVQVLRAKADAAGNLQTTEQQKVIKKPPPPGYAGPAPEVVYYIEPVQPEIYYVPVYDPILIFGVGYWSTIYVAPPFFWYPVWWTPGPIWGFGPAFFVGPAVWCGYNWYSGGVVVNTVLYSKYKKTPHPGGPQFQKVTFHPEHRAGAPFKTQSLQQQYGKLRGGNKGVKTFTGTGGPGGKGGGSKGSKGTSFTTTTGGGGGGPGGKGGGSKGSKGSKGTSFTTTTGGGGGPGGKGGGSKGSKGTSFTTTTGGGGGGGPGSKGGGSKGSKGTSFTTSTGGGGGGAGPKA